MKQRFANIALALLGAAATVALTFDDRMARRLANAASALLGAALTTALLWNGLTLTVSLSAPTEKPPAAEASSLRLSINPLGESLAKLKAALFD